tara:strand:- start:13689 stop:13967 length:279 start_codon:yes stop_codon:yes gene_type:complete
MGITAKEYNDLVKNGSTLVTKDSALDKQIAGTHYKSMAIQPVEFITKNSIGFLEGNIIKYVCRHHAKNGVDDIKKAIHYCELLLETKYGEGK